MVVKREDIIFESENIYYVRVSETLIEDYLKMVNDISVAKLISKNIRTYKYEDELDWINSKLEENAILFSMLEKDSGNFIGNIEMMNCNGHSAELGISITSEMQNKHYGLEGVKTLIDYGFNKLHLNEIDLIVFSSNKRAIKCYKNAGFNEYKVVKDVAIIDGESVDDIYMKIKR